MNQSYIKQIISIIHVVSKIFVYDVFAIKMLLQQH
jgi:hypothetical protein